MKHVCLFYSILFTPDYFLHQTHFTAAPLGTKMFEVKMVRIQNKISLPLCNEPAQLWSPPPSLVFQKSPQNHHQSSPGSHASRQAGHKRTSGLCDLGSGDEEGTQL